MGTVRHTAVANVTIAVSGNTSVTAPWKSGVDDIIVHYPKLQPNKPPAQPIVELIAAWRVEIVIYPLSTGGDVKTSIGTSKAAATNFQLSIDADFPRSMR